VAAIGGGRVTLFGIVLDADNPQGCPDPSELRAFTTARLIAKDSEQLYEYAERLQLAGIEVALVWTLASVGNPPEPDTVRRIADRCRVVYHIVGNEPDAVYNLDAEGNPHPSTASDAMDEDAFADWFDGVAPIIREEQEMAELILAGMVSGQPWAARKYVDAVQARGHQIDGLDLHLYNTPPGDLYRKLSLYIAEFPSRPLYMFEWSRPAHEIADFMKALEYYHVRVACFHAWHETDIVGLHDAAGRETDAYYALIDGITAAKIRRQTEVRMGKLEDTESKEWWKIGLAWKETGETEAPPAMEFQALDGRIMRLRGYDYGVGMEVGSGTVYQPAEATEESFARLMANAIQKRPEVIKAALEAAGFRVVPI
jgi:hypothetical protein